ncbi:hypothetical protein HDU76_010120 [Blyttiomyces sp. JEL0837]|nr:hypothetical protein HDU76_010120 [Blyttiomyces sp. JEL0837]
MVVFSDEDLTQLINTLPPKVQFWFKSDPEIQACLLEEYSTLDEIQACLQGKPLVKFHLKLRAWLDSLSLEERYEKLAKMSLEEIVTEHKATLSGSQPTQVGTQIDPQPVFILKNVVWTVADLDPNGFKTNLSEEDLERAAEPMDIDGAMGAYLGVLDQKRTLRTTRSFATWDELKSQIQNADSKYDIRVESTAGEDQTSATWFELLALVNATDRIVDLRGSENELSSTAHDLIIVSPVVDRVFHMTSGYNRKSAHVYPITLEIDGKQCSYIPQPDLSKNGTGTGNGSDRVMLAFMSRVNLLAASQGQSVEVCKSLVIPSLYYDESAFYLFFTAWASDLETVEFKYVRRYQADDPSGLFLLMFNLYNLRDHTFAVVEPSKKSSYLVALRRKRDLSYHSLKMSLENDVDNRESDESSKETDGGLGHDEIV